MVSTYMCLAVIAEYEIIFVPNTAIAIGAECGYYLYLCTCVVHEIVTIKLYYHHNCKEKDMARSGSKTETLFDDVPEQPKVLRLTLRSKKSTTWQRFKASMATLDLSPAELMKSLNDDRAKLVKKLEDGEDLTDEEIEFDEGMKKELSDILDQLKNQAIETSTISDYSDYWRLQGKKANFFRKNAQRDHYSLVRTMWH